MKKIVLSLAGALAATAFAPEAAAVPAFARQTGMACTACHAQHFPILNSFGRAFKASGYTMMGAQGKVEGDHLSIPDTLNASFVLKVRYQDDNTAGPVAGTTPATAKKAQTVGGGQWQFPDEFALLIGGRVSESIGFIFEGNLMGGQLAAGLRVPITFDMGGAKLSVVPFTTDAMGPQMGYELSSGGVYRANRWSEHRRETSAIQYNADRGLDGGAATGVAFVAQNDMGYIDVTKWGASVLPGPGSQIGTGGDWDSTYVRLAATPTVADWALHVGLGVMSGSSYSNVAALSGTTLAPLGVVDTRQTFFDFQAQGEVAGKELGVYFQHAKAPAGRGVTNAYNGSNCAIGAVCNPDRKAWTLGADYSVIPHVLSIGAAYRNADTGGAAATNGDDAWTITGVYDLYQNVALHLNYSSYSGSSRNAPGAQKSLVTGMLEAAW